VFHDIMIILTGGRKWENMRAIPAWRAAGSAAAVT